MKALTIRQPHATHILEGRKIFEYRSWSTPYRGRLLITVSARPDPDYSWPPNQAYRFPLGCTLCTVALHNVTGSPGDYEWHFGRVEAVPQLPVKGKLGLWTPDAALLSALGLT